LIFSAPGLKIHAKLFLISRKEGDDVVRYAHIGTGNFNEKTARIYTDYSLLTGIAHHVITLFTRDQEQFGVNFQTRRGEDHVHARFTLTKKPRGFIPTTRS
jgi:polyphosphate kinase